MLRLHGFSASNYYNVPKLAFLEKGVSFEEVESYTGVGPKYKPEYLDKSPLGKVPALETEEGFISESRAILEYIESAYPQHPLLPASAFGTAKVQELSQFIELYFELVARRVIPNLLSGTTPEPTVLKRFRRVLLKQQMHWGNFLLLNNLPMAIHLPWRISRLF
jgi:glutathione S-transferase